ncbi:UPF0641 membrane protein [Escovopsis weberi]|uniref:UPF0641 membrane protein n=1 Tax=Escovopsis weberi TaxID=150374 RepID=A0A0M8MZ68_ESCWE|nr:UPF0641 membrane protein [Escovopsis weberi]
MHPLQRLPSPSPSVSLLVHSLGFLSFSSSFHFLFSWDTPIATSYGWYLQFFTIIGLAVSHLCFTLALLADLSSSRALFRLKNVLAVAAAPLESVITLLYWGFSAVDPDLIVPAEYDLPFVQDLGFHAAPAVFLLLDMLLLSPPWTISTTGAAGLAFGLMAAYWVWVELCFSHNGSYPYPLFEILSTWQRAALFACSAVIATASIMASKWLYARVNGSGVPGKAKKL